MDAADLRWHDEAVTREGEYSYSCFCEWDCCDDPAHEKQTGYIVLTPRAGVSVGGIINKLEEHDGLKVIYCIRIPCYLTPEELAQAELYRMEMEEK